MSSPLAFYAYPSQPSDLVETIEVAIQDVTLSGLVEFKSWRQLSVTGKIIIKEILRAIDESDVFACDLTYLNFNVLFELGYAIGRGKRLWISLNTGIEQATRDYQRFTPILSPVGYASYHNSYDLKSALYRDCPWNDSTRPSLDLSLRFSRLANTKPTILHLKSQLETDASIQLSEALQADRDFSVVMDDPSEVSLLSLAWYTQSIIDATGVVAHLLNNKQTNHDWHNAKCSLVCGIAHGLSKRILMVAPEPFDSPFDYQQLLVTHSTAKVCKATTVSWLDQVRQEITAHAAHVAVHQESQQRVIELRQLSVGEFIAENEEDNLDTYFVTTSAFQEACRAQQMIFVGRKGTGKTANLYAIARKYRTSRDNHVCIIKPVGYEVDGVLRMLKQALDRSEKGYLVESLWKFLVYTELAGSVYSEIANQAAYVERTEHELRFTRYVEDNSELILSPFSIRLQNAVESLSDLEKYRSGDEQRARVSEMLHTRFLARLRDELGSVLQRKNKVVVLVDNLDKSWGSREDVAYLAEMLFGLLGIVRRIGEEFHTADSRRKRINLSLVVFLRSDIFTYIQAFAREKDKLLFTRMAWDDPSLLRRVVEERLCNSLDGAVTPDEIWTELFVPSVGGQPTREFITSAVMHRPRDVIYLVRIALDEAVNRGHGCVEEEDLLTAARKYAQFAFDSLIAEDDPQIGRLEAVLYEFAGAERVIIHSDVIAAIGRAGVQGEDIVRYVDMLCDLGFIGLENQAGTFEFLQNEEERRVKQIVARKVAERNPGHQERYLVNPVFHSVLQIR